MKTSKKGITALEMEEGVVLRAYRDSVGVWTIGAGLTAASGVVKPAAGMVISREQATALLEAALPKYEARVARAMPNTAQNEFDAAVSFDWNTGAVDRASWVENWRARADQGVVRSGLLAWSKAKGKVLPGLLGRRKREAAMLQDGIYRTAPPMSPPDGLAQWVIRMGPRENAEARIAFAQLGYSPGPSLDGIAKSSVMRFQADHALTVDGIIGRATLETLQRQIDARASVKTTAAAAVAPVAVSSVPEGYVGLVDQLLGLPFAVPVMIGLGLTYAAFKAWHYRDAIAALPVTPPRVAAFLRSF